MSGVGFILNMIQSLKGNKRTRITTFDKGVDKTTPMYGKFVDHKKMSPEQFAAFQKKLKENNRKNKHKLIFTYSCVMFFILAVIIYFLFFFEIASAKPIEFKVD